MDYLREKQHYIDLYDLHTIDECLYWKTNLEAKTLEMFNDPKVKHIPAEKRKTDLLRLMAITINSIKVVRYKDKAKTIEEWMEKDKTEQDYYDTAQPVEMYCPKCNILLEDFFKTLINDPNKPLKVLFYYKCKKCDYRYGQYDDGTEHISKKETCPTCHCEMIRTDKKKDKTIVTALKCPKCKHAEKSVLDLDHSEWEKKQKDNQERLSKYRQEFCDDTECKKMSDWYDNLKRMLDEWKADKEKDQNPVYQKARQLKKVRIVELNKLLRDVLEKEMYISLQLEKPEMGQFVIVPFLIQDSKLGRTENDSKYFLQKLLKQTLEETNWRLMSEGVNYRVGYLSGRLKCYEREEDLVKVV